jgi:hypothetical protein
MKSIHQVRFAAPSGFTAQFGLTAQFALTAILFAAIVVVPMQAQSGKQESDPDRTVVGSARFPAGWSVRPDRGTAAQLSFTQTGDVFHFVMSSAGTFYNNEWMKSGNVEYSARLTQLKAPSHPISYGLMFGGSNLGGPMQSYSYFLVRNQGEYFVANREGDALPKIVADWTPHQAINKQGKDGRQTNVLGVLVQGDVVVFTVNGQEVTRLPHSRVHTDGLIGFRIGHNLDVDVDQVQH